MITAAFPTRTHTPEQFEAFVQRPRLIAKHRREAGQCMKRALTLELQAPIVAANGNTPASGIMFAEATALRMEYRRLTEIADRLAAMPSDF